ncbi:MAG TPA: hypothetical protein VJV79_22020 [Polyangiaceae bacterium]|nr:hypothetical protein [Polyangiaceae bacterium]
MDVGIELKQAAKCLVVSSLLLGFPRAALADVAACVQAHASGQREAKAGRLKVASELFASCVSQEGCPDAIRAECAEFRKDTERSVPTVIFAAVDEQGGDLIQVRVYSGDQVLSEALDGRPIAVDPGQHHFRFELQSGQVLESDVLVREAEKNRIVSVRTKPAPKPVTVVSAPGADANQTRGKLPTAFWVASGVGAAALVSWGTFAVIGYGKQSTVAECSPNCSASSRPDYDAMQRNYLIADVSLGIAVASAGVATWLFFSSDRSSAVEPQKSANSAARLTVAPLVSTRGAGVMLSASTF